MGSLLESLPLRNPDESRAYNSTNGGDAERFAASLIISSLRGELCWGSREEDNSKIDLVISCEHPWYKGERMMILAQAKSGPSYGERLTEGFKLKSSAITAAKRTAHAICVIWVCRSSNKAFWAYIHSNSKTAPREYGAYHEVSPAMLYDLARCMSRNIAGTTEGKGIIIRKRDGNLTNRRKNVLSAYRSLTKAFSPTVGNVELTRLGWRHMFRAGRSAKRKQSSLDLIPHLKRILLQHPSENAITAYSHREKNGYIYRSTEHLLKYQKVKLSSKQEEETKSTTVFIRLIEEVRYPSDWSSTVMLTQRVERRVVLKSAYYKLEKSD